MIRRLLRYIAKRRVRYMIDLARTTVGNCVICDDATLLYDIRGMWLCESCWTSMWSWDPSDIVYCIHHAPSTPGDAQSPPDSD